MHVMLSTLLGISPATKYIYLNKKAHEKLLCKSQNSLFLCATELHYWLTRFKGAGLVKITP